MRQIGLDLYRFFRLSAFGATAVLPLLGAASADGELSGRQAAGLLGVAAAFHAFAYVHNDVCDLEIDRTQPLRAAYPLVRGAVPPRAALAVALAWVPAAFAVAERVRSGQPRLVRRLPIRSSRRTGGSYLPRSSRSSRRFYSCKLLPDLRALRELRGREYPTDAPVWRAYLGAAFALMAAYNHWGKRCPFPPLTDLVQGLGWSALLGYGAAAVGRPTHLTRLLAAYEVLLILMVNGVHGALRDLANDQAAGARTTAIMLGAEEREGRLAVPPTLAAYALALQAALIVVPLWGALANVAGHPARERAAALAGVGLLAALTLALLGAAARGGARPADVGMLHLILILSPPLALAAPGMAPAPRAALLLAHVLPLLANGMTYDALRWAITTTL